MRASDVIRNSALMLLLLGACAAWAQAPEVPLGDVVKRPKPAKKATRVITDDDMPHHPPAAVPSVTPDPAVDQDKKAADKNVPAATEGSPLARRIGELKAAESAEEQVIKDFEDKLKESTLSEIERKTYTDSINQSKAMLESYQKQLAVLKKVAANSPSAPTDARTDDKRPNADGPEPKPQEVTTEDRKNPE